MLSSVPMQIPMPGFTLEQYLHYLSWRIEVQMVATCLNEWREAGSRATQKAPILKALAAVSKRSEKFPAIELPNDIVDPITSRHLDLPTMIQELEGLIENVQLTAGNGAMSGTTPSQAG
jgi:hypothetical protein